MSLRQKTISGAKWSAIATIVIIGLGLIQMTVLARIIDNHQFGLLTVSLVIIALADTISDFGIANSIIQRKTIGHLELTTLYWLNVGLGIVVFAVVFWLSDAIAHVLHNPDLAPLIKTLSLAFIVIPHGQQFRALMQKELEFNKIGMIETTSVLAGFTFTVISAPLLAAGVNRDSRLSGEQCGANAALWLLWPQDLPSGAAFFADIGVHEPAFWRVADGGQYRQLHQHEFIDAGTGENSRRKRRRGI
ncbi:colanic acid exporter [Salmonella enterica subsp. enterica]|nr:colanic acid exporter [Salmonella enterica subsp. enterica] [Salmonella enterica subsp. enterica serovar Menston]